MTQFAALHATLRPEGLVTSKPCSLILRQQSLQEDQKEGGGDESEDDEECGESYQGASYTILAQANFQPSETGSPWMDAPSDNSSFTPSDNSSFTPSKPMSVPMPVPVPVPVPVNTTEGRRGSTRPSLTQAHQHGTHTGTTDSGPKARGRPARHGGGPTQRTHAARQRERGDMQVRCSCVQTVQRVE